MLEGADQIEMGFQTFYLMAYRTGGHGKLYRGIQQIALPSSRFKGVQRVKQ